MTSRSGTPLDKFYELDPISRLQRMDENEGRDTYFHESKRRAITKVKTLNALYHATRESSTDSSDEDQSA